MLAGAGARAFAHFFLNDGSLKPAAPMLVPRAAHVCIALQDGSILVAGGVSGPSGPGGPTNSVELYDLGADTWTATGAMLTARTNAAAILLKDGRVLITGGESSGQIANILEIYDHAENRFRAARGVLSSPLAGHAIALLNDGRVLFAGGFDGERSLASSGLYDPATTLFSPGSPLLTPRRHHTAVRPAGVENALIWGDAPGRGSSSRAHARRAVGGELFVPALNEFVPAREIAAADANGEPSAQTEAHVTVAALDAEANPRDVRFYLLKPDSGAENSDTK